MSRQLYVGIIFLLNTVITQSLPFILLKAKSKCHPRIAFMITVLWDFTLFSIPRIRGVVPSLPKSVLLGILPPFLWCYLFFDVPLWKRVFVPVLEVTVTFCIDWFCLRYLFVVIGGGYRDILYQNEYFFAGITMYNMLLLAVYVLLFLLWRRLVDRKKTNKSMFLYAVISLYQFILLSLFLVIRRNASGQIMWISLSFLFASFLLNILMYYFFRHIEKMADTKAQFLALRLEKEAVRECQIIEEQNIWKLKTLHDEFVNQIQNVLCMVQNEMQSASLSETLLQSKEILDNAKQEFYSYSPVLNALFTVKVHDARARGIDVFVNCHHNADFDIADIDLCSIMGNLMDNAVEACDRSDGGCKMISASVTQKANYLILKVENTVGTDFTMPSRKHPTSKADQRSHGIGLKLVEQICKQYNGRFTFELLSENTVCAAAILKERTKEYENSAV